MPKDTDKPFIFNDENQANTYGFKIPTKGINLKRFKKNPVMLDSHHNSTRAVIGSWEKVKADSGILTGQPVFDGDDDDTAAYIKGKVDRGFIKSCSMGLTFNRDDFEVIDGELTLKKCELMEVSIVAIPSNSNAVRLYASDDDSKMLSDQEVQNLCLSALNVVSEEVVPSTQKNQNKNMSKITLTAAVATALGFSEGTTEAEASEINAKVLAMSATLATTKQKLTDEEAKVLQHETAAETARLAGINTQVDNAITEGRITADNKQKFVNLGVANAELLTSTLSAIPAKASLAAQVAASAKPSEVKSVEDFLKLSHEEKLAFKTANPAEYSQLFTKNQ